MAYLRQIPLKRQWNFRPGRDLSGPAGAIERVAVKWDSQTKNTAALPQHSCCEIDEIIFQTPNRE
jgi:hypothetical protein